MNRHKRIARVVYKDVEEEEPLDRIDGNLLRSYMVLVLPDSFNPQDKLCSQINVVGGINLAGDFTTCVGYNAAKCVIQKPTLKDYLELSNALKYGYSYNSVHRKRRGY